MAASDTRRSDRTPLHKQVNPGSGKPGTAAHPHRVAFNRR